MKKLFGEGWLWQWLHYGCRALPFHGPAWGSIKHSDHCLTVLMPFNVPAICIYWLYRRLQLIGLWWACGLLEARVERQHRTIQRLHRYLETLDDQDKFAKHLVKEHGSTRSN